MQNVPFIAFLNTAAVTQRKPASFWISSFIRRAQGHNETDIFSSTCHLPPFRRKVAGIYYIIYYIYIKVKYSRYRPNWPRGWIEV
jgi:hypothetical protein